jgi:hypothetical protein
MKIIPSLGLSALCVALSGCVGVFEGASQDITVVANPVGAWCTLEREGMTIGSVARTPGVLTVRKSKYDITVRCYSPGFQTAAYVNHSGVSATVAAKIAADPTFAGGISSIVDSVIGADSTYDSIVNITLIPIPQSPNPQAAIYRPAPAIASAQTQGPDLRHDELPPRAP